MASNSGRVSTTRGGSLATHDRRLAGGDLRVDHDDLRGERELGPRGCQRVPERADFFFCDQAMLPPDVDSSADIPDKRIKGSQTRLLRRLAHDAPELSVVHRHLLVLRLGLRVVRATPSLATPDP